MHSSSPLLFYKFVIPFLSWALPSNDHQIARLLVPWLLLPMCYQTILKESIDMLGLEYILKIENITRSELANRLGVSTSVVSRWMKRKRPFPSKRIEQICTDFFPYCPIEYCLKEINEYDMAILRNLKREYKRQSSAKILYPLATSALLKELGVDTYLDGLANEKLDSFDIEIYDQLKEVFRGIISRYEKRNKIYTVLTARLEMKKKN